MLGKRGYENADSDKRRSEQQNCYRIADEHCRILLRDDTGRVVVDIEKQKIERRHRICSGKNGICGEELSSHHSADRDRRGKQQLLGFHSPIIGEQTHGKQRQQKRKAAYQHGKIGSYVCAAARNGAEQRRIRKEHSAEHKINSYENIAYRRGKI